MQVTGIEGSSFHRERGEQRRKGTTSFFHVPSLARVTSIGDQHFPTVKMMINENSKEDLDELLGSDESSAMVGSY